MFKTDCKARMAQVLAGFALLCLLAPQAYSEQGPDATVVYKKTADAEGEPVALKLHLFKPEGWSADDQRPAIVFFFGGGWAGGTPKQFYPHCKDLAARGMVAISAEYRVRNRHGTPPQACVEDGKSAVRYLRANAARLGVDPQRIVAAGGSAGGHVAACTGIIRGYEAEGEDHSISSVPNLLALFNPVIDTSPQTGYGAGRIKPDPLALSPLHQAHKDQPPCVIVHGDADKTVSIGSVRRFTQRSNKLGASVTLHETRGAGHGFFNHPSFQEKRDPRYYAKTMGEVGRFLEKHGYLDAKDNADGE